MTDEGRRGSMLVAAVGIALGLLLTAVIKERFAHASRYTLRPGSIAIDDAPAWFGDRERDLTSSFRAQVAPVSIFDRELPRRIAAVSAANPWIARVRQIRRRLPAQLEVVCDLRRPVAVLVLGGERIALDRDGVVLERDSGLAPDEVPELRLLAERSLRVPRPGARAESEGVREALAVLDQLRPYRRSPPLAGLALVLVTVGVEGESRPAGAADIVLELEPGARIRWGRSPISPLAVLDLPLQEKLGNLARVLRAHPGLLGVAEVDLRARDPLVKPRG